MFKIAYLTDMHLGGDGTGFHHQPPCQEKIPALVKALSETLRNEGVELLILGGDMTDQGNPDQIRQFQELFLTLSMDVRLVLGNHDLATLESFDAWRGQCPSMFQADDTSPWGDFAIRREGCLLIGLQNTWKTEPNTPDHYWEARTCEGALLAEQIQWFGEIPRTHSSEDVILFLHELLFPLYPEQTGLAEPVHAPTSPVIQELSEMIRQAGNVRMVFSGHCHATSVHWRNGQAFLTTAAFVEPPFQFRLIRIDEKEMDVSTRDFASLAGDVILDDAKRWVLGTADSRHVRIER